ncbi:MAG: PKD domain-containing protein [Saprospiraceae bacterium]|nr:PKD domain-containing protein [Saprospiraceae bacterium]
MNLNTKIAINILFFMLLSQIGFGQKPQSEKNEREKNEDIRARIEQEIYMTKDPKLGYVPTERLIAAKSVAERQKNNGSRDALSGVSWKPLGPKNRGGRSRTMLIDANDPTGKTVFVGSVGGGLWKTTDITLTDPIWNPVNDLMGNLAVTSIAQHPSNAMIIYLCTGEGYNNGDAIRGLGVWKSTDGGTSWTQLAATNNSDFYYCQKILVSSTGILFVATKTGLRRSANGGTTFTKVLGSGLGITGAGNDFAYDIEIASNGDVYGSLSGSIHKSTDEGVTFDAAPTLPVSASRIELSCAASDAAYVYAICYASNVVSGIIRTTDSGLTWLARTNISGGSQGWYDLCIGVDPNNRDVLFVGEIDLWKSINGASTWTNVTNVYSGGYVHPDQHNIVYKSGSSSEAYITNDGGIYRSTNINAATPLFFYKGNNYITTQFYACAMHPTALTNYFLAGAQDNNTFKFTSGILQNGIVAWGGDGAFCHIDQNQPQYQIVSSQNGNYGRTNDWGTNWTSGPTISGGRFINPSDYDNVNNIMYSCAAANNYKRWDDMPNGNTVTNVAMTFGGQISAVKVSPNTSNRVFFGIDNGRVYRIDDANSSTGTSTNISTGLPSGYINCIEVETGNDNHLMVVYTNYGVNSVWESINGGTSWTSVEGNLPDMPIRWALFNPSNTDQAILATELGIWSTDNLNGASTVWGTSNTGLANVKVSMLQMRQSDKLVIAATHGRGLYFSDIFTSPTALFDVEKKVGYIGTGIKFLSTSYKATSWSWNFGDGNVSALENPVYAYATSGLFTVSLTINNGASTITKTGLILILPNKSIPYLIADGGGFEINPNDFGVDHIANTSWEKGSSNVGGKNGTHGGSNAWVTGLTGSYADNTESNLMTPNYDFFFTRHLYFKILVQILN